MKLAVAQKIHDPTLRDVIQAITTQVNVLAEGRLSGRHFNASVVPTTGSFAQSDIVWDSRASVSGSVVGSGINAVRLGWVNTSPGNPGTMTPFYALTDTSGINSIPTGTILPFGGTSAPAGYLSCDGSAVSRTTYAALFAVIGTTWGTGDGSTTFNVPNAQRKTLVGSGGAGTSTLGNAVGNSGGEETHTLTGAESGTSVHTHPDTFAASFGVSTDVTSTAGTLLGDSNASVTNTTIRGNRANNAGTQTTQTVTVSGAVSNSSAANASSAHNNIQPSIVVNYIIKT